jgi:hypothetical protein
VSPEYLLSIREVVHCDFKTRIGREVAHTHVHWVGGDHGKGCGNSEEFAIFNELDSQFWKQDRKDQVNFTRDW